MVMIATLQLHKFERICERENTAKCHFLNTLYEIT